MLGKERRFGGKIYKRGFLPPRKYKKTSCGDPTYSAINCFKRLLASRSNPAVFNSAVRSLLHALTKGSIVLVAIEIVHLLLRHLLSSLPPPLLEIIITQQKREEAMKQKRNPVTRSYVRNPRRILVYCSPTARINIALVLSSAKAEASSSTILHNNNIHGRLVIVKTLTIHGAVTMMSRMQCGASATRQEKGKGTNTWERLVATLHCTIKNETKTQTFSFLLSDCTIQSDQSRKNSNVTSLVYVGCTICL